MNKKIKLIVLLIILIILIIVLLWKNKDKKQNQNNINKKNETIIKIDDENIDVIKNSDFEKELNLIIDNIKKTIEISDESKISLNTINHYISINNEKIIYFTIDEHLKKIKSYFRIKNKNNIEQYISFDKDHKIKEYPEIIEKLEKLLKSADINIEQLYLKEKNLYKDFDIIFYDQTPMKKNIIKSKNDQYDFNIYSYGGNVKIYKDGQEINLRDALMENKISIEDILNKCKKEAYEKKMKFEIYKDGGSQEYKNNSYTIIKMNKNKMNDIYFTKKM